MKFAQDIVDDEAQDLLGREGLLSTMVTAVQAIRTPGCVALYGPWGSGKTTLLRLLKRGWRAQAKPALWFDPWHYERQGDVLIPLVQMIGRETFESTPTAEHRALAEGALKTALSVSFRLGLSAAAYLSLGPAAAALSPLTSLTVEDFEKYFPDRKALTAHANAIEELQTSFCDLVHSALRPFGESARLLVLIDDLDRCLPDTVVALIEAIKLFLCGAPTCNVVFVFALDRGVVGEAIRHRYPNASAYTGDHYLENIFDLSFETPLIEDSMLDARFDEMLTKGAQPGHAFDSDLLRKVLGQPVFANPRTIKRTLNKVQLLQSSQAMAKIDAATAEKVLMYLAGAERFREFREVVRLGTRDEFAALLEPGAQMKDAALSPAGRRLAAVPGFRVYLRLLGVTGSESIPALLGIDRLLRSVGL